MRIANACTDAEDRRQLETWAKEKTLRAIGGTGRLLLAAGGWGWDPPAARTSTLGSIQSDDGGRFLEAGCLASSMTLPDGAESP